MNRRTLAVIGRNTEQLELHTHAIRSTGARCRVLPWSDAGIADACAGTFDALVISGLTRPERARLLRALDGCTGARPRTIAAAGTADLPGDGDAALDAVTLVPVAPATVLYATGLWPGATPRELACDAQVLVGTTALTDGADPVGSVLRDVVAAYDAAAAVYLSPTGSVHCAFDTTSSRDARARAALVDRARTICHSSAPVVGAAVATAAASSIETAVATGGLCLFLSGLVTADQTQRNLLGALARRLTAEVSQRTLQRRLVSDLAASRASGGIDSRFGVWARPALDRLFEVLIANHRRAGRPAALAVADVRGMADINDRFGHPAGDAVLRHVAQQARHAIRSQDVVAHFGGDDIALFLGGATAHDGERVVERLRAQIAAEPLQVGDAHIPIDFAAGVVEVRPDESVELVLARAARAVERARDGSGPVRIHLDSDPGRPVAELFDRDCGDVDGEILAGAYRLRHEISRGGVGVVYRADDLALRRPVAIKILRPDLARDASFVARFRDEAAILASLRHPNVVQIYTAGVDDGRAFFAMELVEGRSVAEAIDTAAHEGKALPTSLVASVLGQLGGALTALHERGVLHRDVKPANILLDPFRDRSVLVDVGLARRRGDAIDVAGTPGYVAPEVLNSADYSPATDVYGLAATAYEMLALQLPWPAANDPLALVRMQTEVAPTPLFELRPDLGPEVSEIIMRGLAVDRRARWQTAAALTDALVAALAAAGPGDATAAPAPLARPRATDATCMDLADPSEIDRPYTRGVAFRMFARVLGPRETAQWRARIGPDDARRHDALSPTTEPMRWLPTDLLVDLMHASPPGERTPEALGRELGRATVRATFRRFFPASSATLVPSGTLAALPVIWQRYHSWGRVEIVPRGDCAADVRVLGTPGDPGICGWIQGMLEQLISLSGGADVHVTPTACELSGADACAFSSHWLPRERRELHEVQR